ncbi:MAG: hypothetical protein IT337_07790 [Thermomicrobiales bacterium]|nr:hypothetical protein [Thermomicrobiales bacterium]
MPEESTLHPFDEETVRRYVAAVRGDAAPETVVPNDPNWSRRVVERARAGYARAVAGDEAGANAVSLGLARALAALQPTFVLPGAALTPWEARIDRGVGMLMRPPSRLFGEAGLAVPAARAMPIRLDPGAGMMGGAFVPARLVPQLRAQLEAREARLVRRMTAAEMDGVALYGQMLTAAAYAEERGLGLYEALDAVTPGERDANPAAAIVLLPDRQRLDPALRHRLEEAAKPPRKPGLIARLRGRSADPPGPPPAR